MKNFVALLIISLSMTVFPLPANAWTDISSSTSDFDGVTTALTWKKAYYHNERCGDTVPSLGLWCSSEGLAEIWLHQGCFLTGYDSRATRKGNIEYRLDEGDTHRWDMKVHRSSNYTFGLKKSHRAIASLYNTREISIRYHVDGKEAVVRFYTTGIKEQINKMEHLCYETDG